MNAQPSGRQHQGVRHVIAIADERQLDAVETSKAFLQREHIGQNLARMIAVTERIDHRHVRPLGQFLNGRLREHARHDALRPALQIAGDVLDRLALANGAGVIDGIAAQLLDGELEGEPRAQRWLFEQQAQVASARGFSKNAPACA